jgi:hypothetical protein
MGRAFSNIFTMRSNAYNGGRWQHIFALVVKVMAVAVGAWFIYTGDYAYALFALPVFLLDLCVAEALRHDLIISIFKAFLLCQVVALWYLNVVHFFDIPANSMQNALKFHEQFDWQNTTSAIRGFGERAVHSLTAGSIYTAPAAMLFSTQTKLFPVRSVGVIPSHICPQSRAFLNQTFGELPATDFPDLRYYTKDEIHARFPTIFQELPPGGFDARYKNPCWHVVDRSERLACLPYAYVLGQPKSGTSDLFERLKGHNDVM